MNARFLHYSGRPWSTACAAATFAVAVLGVLGAQARAAAASLDAPPAGITPTTVALKDVLAAADRAAGKSQAGWATRDREWTISAYGLSGSSSAIDNGADSRQTITLGPFTEIHGSFHGQRWRRNENGLLIHMSGIHQRDAVDERAVEAATKTGAAPGVRLLGEVKTPIAARVVEVNPPGGRLQWLFYETSSGRLVRTEAVVVDRRVVTTFDDFRTTGGLTEPWHYRIDDGRPANLEDWHQTEERAVSAPAPSAFAPPADAQLLTFPAQPAPPLRLPARIVNGKIIVRVDIGGRGFDFMLDSGASSIVIDEQVAKSLNLTAFGRSVRETAGTYDESSVIVPELRVGDIVMRSVAASALPFQSNPVSGTRVVGLLGFDFVDSLVLRIDYEHGALDAYPAAAPPPLPPNAVELSAALDDGIPDVRALVAGAIGEHFIIDTGATAGVLFSEFAAAHPDAVRDEGLGFRLMQDNPFQFAGGVGGTLHVAPVQVKAFGASSVELPDFLAYVVRGSRSYEGEDEDGLIGYAYLKYFTVYLDYRRRRVLLVRNGLAYEPPTFSTGDRMLP